MTFDVVKVNAKGQEVEREKAEASYFTQDLGNGITLEMVAFPGGTFLMGSSTNEKDSYEDEPPQHEVTVPPLPWVNIPSPSPSGERSPPLPSRLQKPRHRKTKTSLSY